MRPAFVVVVDVASWLEALQSKASSGHVGSLSKQLSEVVAENHERHSLAQTLAIRHQSLEQELPVIDLVIPCIEIPRDRASN
jgi:hypothetical protein